MDVCDVVDDGYEERKKRRKKKTRNGPYIYTHHLLVAGRGQ